MPELDSDADDVDSISLREVSIDDHPEYTAHVIAAIYELDHVRDRRTQKRDIRDHVAVDLSRDQVRYRLDQLRSEGVVYQNTYMEHDTRRVEYHLDTRESYPGAPDPDDLRADARACHGAVDVLTTSEARDPSMSTMIALAGRVCDAEARLARLEEAVDVDEGDDDAGLSDYV